MKTDALRKVLAGINWNGNSREFSRDGSQLARMHKCHLRLAIWSKQFEIADRDNPALCFIRTMQLDGYYCVVLASLALYKPAAGSMRSMIESALYYTYFRSHLVELGTLARDVAYFVQKTDVINHHFRHTPGFKDDQEALHLQGKLNELYKRFSMIIHGQIPGTWAEHSSLGKIKHVGSTLEAVVSEFEAAEEVVHRLFLCTAGKALWADFSSTAKSALLKGLDGNAKKAIGLTLA